MNRSKLDQLDAKHQELTSALLHEIGKGTAADFARMMTVTDELRKTMKAVFHEAILPDVVPGEPSDDPLYWCHELALDTLRRLGGVVGEFNPESVLILKHHCFDPEGFHSYIIGSVASQLGPDLERVRSIKAQVGEQAGKAIIHLRDEYLSWIEYREEIPRFDSLQRAPVTLCRFTVTSAHALLVEIVRRVLNGAWHVIHPWEPGQPYTDEEHHWPSSAGELYKADLDEMARAVMLRKGEKTDDLIDAECIEWIDAALQQEYARLMDPGQTSEADG